VSLPTLSMRHERAGIKSLIALIAVLRAPRKWQLWRLAPSARLALITADVLAVVLTVVGLVAVTPPDAPAWMRAGLLLAVAIGYALITTRVELIRTYQAANGDSFANVTSVWVIAAALTLSPGYAALVNMLIVAYTVAWQIRTKSSKPHRVIFVGAAGVLATLAAATLANITGATHGLLSGHWTPLAAVGVVLAVVVWEIVDAGIVTAGMYVSMRPPRFRDLLMDRDNYLMEAVTLVLGAFVAVALAETPWLVPAIALVLIVVQRAVLVTQLQAAVETDAKTGLLTSDTWERRAERELARAGRANTEAAVLVIDLDHFKKVNDEHGHLTGDAVLKAAAEGVQSELRGYDMASRHGGEEFAVLVDGTDAAQALAIANRIRARIAANTGLLGVPVTASVGIACFPAHGTEVRELFETADMALYEAKRAGRDIAVVANRAPSSDELHAELEIAGD
jgi:diguanylate cyclase (GGDEF)-like protein